MELGYQDLNIDLVTYFELNVFTFQNCHNVSNKYIIRKSVIPYIKRMIVLLPSRAACY